MAYTHPSKEELKEILTNAKKIAVVGLSNNPEKTSYMISKAMQDAGFQIIPVNPTVDEVLGEKAVKSLKEIHEHVDIVNVFRRSEYLPEIAQEFLEIDADVFWAQQGVINEEAYELIKKNNKQVIMDLCIKVAHSLVK